MAIRSPLENLYQRIIFILDRICLRLTRKWPLALFQGKNIFSCAFKCKDGVNLFGFFGFISSKLSNLAIFPIATRFFASGPIENFQKFHLLQNIVLLLKLAEKGNQERKRYLDINLNLKAPVLIYIYTSRHFVFVKINVFRVCILLSRV